MVVNTLRFQVPLTQRTNLSQAFKNKKSQTTHIKTQYYDTPDRQLAAAHLELYVHSDEDHQSIQTLKSTSSSFLQSVMHQVNLGSTETSHIDVALYRGTPVGEILFACFQNETPVFILQFETDIVRTWQNFEDQHSQIQVSLDIGEIHTETDHLPIYELKFELKTGAAADLFSLIKSWVVRYGVWLDLSSKVARDDQLRRRLNALPATQARKLLLKQNQSAESALSWIVANCLEQILPNVTEVAANIGGVEHIHQARVGIRRLRSALRVFGHWSKQINPAWELALKALFNQLGTIRDRDALEEKLLPKLRAAGAPYTELPALVGGGHVAMQQALTHYSCTELWLALIQLIESSFEEQQQNTQDELTILIATDMKRMHQQLLKDAENCLDVKKMMWHRTRKRLKRLRYCVEFVSSLYEFKPVQQYLETLRPIQDVLGQYNDVLIAEALFKQQVAQHPQAWFALGWLAAHRDQLQRESALALQKLKAAKIFW